MTGGWWIGGGKIVMEDMIGVVNQIGTSHWSCVKDLVPCKQWSYTRNCQWLPQRSFQEQTIGSIGVNPGEVATPRFWSEGHGRVAEVMDRSKNINNLVMYRKYVRKWWLLKRNRIICPEIVVNNQWNCLKNRFFSEICLENRSFLWNYLKNRNFL